MKFIFTYFIKYVKMTEQELRQQLFEKEDLLYQKIQKQRELKFFEIKYDNIADFFNNEMETNELKNKLLKNEEEFNNSNDLYQQNIDTIIKVKVRKSLYDSLEIAMTVLLLNENFFYNFSIICKKTKYTEEVKQTLNKFSDFVKLFNSKNDEKDFDENLFLKTFFENNAKHNLKDFILDYEKYEKNLNIEIFHDDNENDEKFDYFNVIVHKKK